MAGIPGRGARSWAGLCTLLLLATTTAASRSFAIHNDTFVKDGEPFQIISGSIHYFRIHPALWRDRLERVKALGLNAITVYVAWNQHEPKPGHMVWDGWADVEGFLALAAELELLVVLRPGPYICAEWDFGGLPWWLASSKVTPNGAQRMALRSSDSVYLALVDRWWGDLLGRMAPLLYGNGGPIIMVQIENEYGFCGSDKAYLRHLVGLARRHLGNDIILFTTDPANVAEKGTLPGDEVFTAVDFGPGWFYPDQYFGVQKSLNAPGLSPPFNSEFYSGWLSHWGEGMANTSSADLTADTVTLLRWGGRMASLSFYMVHGGTNFGFTQGANVASGGVYQPHITSYDYDAPISEAGDYCQPGIAGACKYHALRAAIQQETGRQPPEPPPRPRVVAYGAVELTSTASLLAAAPHLVRALPSETVLPMEEYDQRWGLILYRHALRASDLRPNTVLDFGVPPHDFATVFIKGIRVGELDRNTLSSLQLDAALLPFNTNNEEPVYLDILVHAMGRQNFGCDAGGWDLKGLQSVNLALNGTLGKQLRGWEVFPMELDDLSRLQFDRVPSALSSRRAAGAEPPSDEGPVFYRGSFTVGRQDLNPATGLLADTYLSTRGWSKGVAWVNGFNLGWHWARKGPQMTLYVPGPVLREGENELILLEVEKAGHRSDAHVDLVAEPDFWGPGGQAAAGLGQLVSPGDRQRGAVPDDGWPGTAAVAVA